MIAESQLDEPGLIENAKSIFDHGIAYSNGEEFLRIVPEFADVIFVLSDSYFPSHNTGEESIKRRNHEVL